LICQVTPWAIPLQSNSPNFFRKHRASVCIIKWTSLLVKSKTEKSRKSQIGVNFPHGSINRYASFHFKSSKVARLISTLHSLRRNLIDYFLASVLDFTTGFQVPFFFPSILCFFSIFSRPLPFIPYFILHIIESRNKTEFPVPVPFFCCWEDFFQTR